MRCRCEHKRFQRHGGRFAGALVLTGLKKLGAEIVLGDLLEIDTILAAMEGVDAAYFVWPVQPGLIQATVNFIQAAKESGVKIAVNLSQRSANRDSTSHSCRDSFIAEQVFNWSGLSVIHLRPTYFLEWLLYPWQLPFLQKGVLRMPVSKGRHSPIAADDQGRAIAALLKARTAISERPSRSRARSRWIMSRWRSNSRRR